MILVVVAVVVVVLLLLHGDDGCLSPCGGGGTGDELLQEPIQEKESLPSLPPSQEPSKVEVLVNDDGPPAIQQSDDPSEVVMVDDINASQPLDQAPGEQPSSPATTTTTGTTTTE